MGKKKREEILGERGTRSWKVGRWEGWRLGGWRGGKKQTRKTAGGEDANAEAKRGMVAVRRKEGMA